MPPEKSQAIKILTVQEVAKLFWVHSNHHEICQERTAQKLLDRQAQIVQRS